MKNKDGGTHIQISESVKLSDLSVIRGFDTETAQAQYPCSLIFSLVLNQES